jgi:hypothetical protein
VIFTTCWRNNSEKIFVGQQHHSEALSIRLTQGDSAFCFENITCVKEGRRNVLMRDARRILQDLPQTIRVDNSPEFVSRSSDMWAYFSGVKLDFSRPG